MTQAVVATLDGRVGEQLVAELEGEGLVVSWVSDGLAALEAAADAGSIAFVEVDLPIFDGLEFAARVRADPDFSSNFPIILISGRDVEPHALERAGISHVLPKTHTAQDVRELLSRFLYQF